jgi:hypothetical protein
MAVPLSAKAKGKQRAVEPVEEDVPVQELTRELTIRFTEGIPDLVLQVKPPTSVRDVKKIVSLSSMQCPPHDMEFNVDSGCQAPAQRPTCSTHSFWSTID